MGYKVLYEADGTPSYYWEDDSADEINKDAADLNTALDENKFSTATQMDDYWQNPYTLDPNTGEIRTDIDPITGINKEAPGWLKELNRGGDFAKAVLSGKSSYGTVGQLAGYAALGAAAKKMGLVNDGQQGIYKGYEGGIPSLVATRQQVPLGDTKNYRPGQGGRTYFTPTQYVAPSAAGEALTGQRQEAKDIAAQQVPVAKAAGGGISALGGYSDGGRMLRGPGDGVSDSIPATIGGKQPARLADGEFVVPARIVSEIGNGSSEAGARKLYAMMDRIQNARKKSIKNVAANTKADKYLPR